MMYMNVSSVWISMFEKKSLQSMHENKKKYTHEKTGTKAVTNFQTTEKKIFFHLTEC